MQTNRRVLHEMHSTASNFSPMTWAFGGGAPDLVNSYDFPMCHGMLNRSKAWHVNAPRRIPIPKYPSPHKPTPTPKTLKTPEKPGLTATRCENSQVRWQCTQPQNHPPPPTRRLPLLVHWGKKIPQLD